MTITYQYQKKNYRDEWEDVGIIHNTLPEPDPYNLTSKDIRLVRIRTTTEIINIDEAQEQKYFHKAGWKKKIYEHGIYLTQCKICIEKLEVKNHA